MTQTENSAVRTRDEQLASYPETVCVGQYPGKSWVLEIDMDDLDPDQLIEDAVSYVRGDIAYNCEKQAEARGAEEQRRKDAEGCEIVRQYLTSRNQWEDCSQDHIWAMAIESDATRRTLYTRPANVAVLEAALRTIADRADREGATIDDDECAVIARAALTREGGE